MPERKSSTDSRAGLQRAVEAVENRQQRLQRFRQRVVAKILLLFHAALAEVVELGLQPRQAIEIARALGAQRLQLRFEIDSASRREVASSLSADGSSCSIPARSHLRFVLFDGHTHSLR